MRGLCALTMAVVSSGCVDDTPTPSRAIVSTPPSLASDSVELATPEKKAAAQKKAVVSLTAAAQAKIRAIRQQSGKPYLRVSVVRGGSTGFKYDLQFDDRVEPDKDFVDEMDGFAVVIDQTSSLFLEGASIDWQVTEDGKEGFHFDNPNAVAE